MTLRFPWLCCLLAAPLLAGGCDGCGRQASAPSNAEAAPSAPEPAESDEVATPAPDSAPEAPPAAAPAPLAMPAPNDPVMSGIADALEIVRSAKAPPQQEALTLTVTNKSKENVAAANFWVYVYDAKGDLVDRALGQALPPSPLAPGAKLDVHVGPLKSTPADRKTIEAAVIWLRLADDRMWQNTGRAPQNRPKGWKAP